jgi:hypothetical protein
VGVDVMITIFTHFRRKHSVFLENQWYDSFFAKISSVFYFEQKVAIFLQNVFRKDILKIITSAPESSGKSEHAVQNNP